MYEAEEICDRVAIMDKGRVAALDKPHVLRETIGGETSIRIKVKGDQTAKALKVLEKYNHIVKDSEIQLLVKDPWEIMPEISNKLASAGILTERIEVVEPTLEDVFVKLTGRRLTEGSN
jgi:ABC-2 type transport system ATP-binding protein